LSVHAARGAPAGRATDTLWRQMRLADVIVSTPLAAGELEVLDLAYDHREVREGTLFFCVPGHTRDGHDFAAAAAASGAVALVVQHPVEVNCPQVQVADVRAAMAQAAAAFYGHPSQALKVVGVTGTNGKTTTAFLMRALLEAGGLRCGLLGTVKRVVGGVEYPVARTTPEAIDLQRELRAMLDAGDRACAMEVSSHALALRRADGVHFAAAIFTNLTQDHLDFHGTMEAYFQAKRRLFCELAPDVAVINVDDPYGARLAAELPGAITFALGRDADYRAVELDSGPGGSGFRVLAPDTSILVRSPLSGRFNVANVLGALAAARALGVDLKRAVEAIASAGQVPGRFEAVEEGQPFTVLVDYAHTPDSLANVLTAARELTTGRVHVAFGCGGDRDRGKRPLMGQIATALADRVIITSDNPRSEDPEAIVAEIAAGAGEGARIEVDRRRAIAEVLAGAAPGDVVVIAGKGHEQGQEIAGGVKLPFDDVTVARELLRGAALGAGARS
jgi:UDP-N-acetylmuramoyl-L-alanyl-D-glutamate--2,6-diaminopimelate ligase